MYEINNYSYQLTNSLQSIVHLRRPRRRTSRTLEIWFKNVLIHCCVQCKENHNEYNTSRNSISPCICSYMSRFPEIRVSPRQNLTPRKKIRHTQSFQIDRGQLHHHLLIHTRILKQLYHILFYFQLSQILNHSLHTHPFPLYSMCTQFFIFHHES